MVTMPKLTEAQLQKAIVQTAKQLGFLVYHSAYSIGSERGFPDLCICGHGRLWFFELKGPKPKVYPEQEAWIAALQAAGMDARFVYPDDLDDVLNELMTAYQEAA
jgi:hypothetical protein